MSEENVGIVRKMCEDYAEGRSEAALEHLDPEIKWHGTIGGIEEGNTSHGRDEVISGFESSSDAWESLSIEPQQFFDAGDRVVVFWHEIAKGKGSGIEMENDTGVIFTLRDGKVVEVQAYMDRQQALRDAGL